MKFFRKCVLIDHKDSFVDTLKGWLCAEPFPLEVEVVDYENWRWENDYSDRTIVLGPGPYHPSKAEKSIAFVQKNLGKVPIVGICLGHQILAVATGGKVSTSTHAWHGQQRSVRNLELNGTKAVWQVGSYNSLVVSTLNDRQWVVTGRNTWDEVEMMHHKQFLAIGLQFHPESFLTEGSTKIKRSIFCTET